ncbi:hypothetical protein BACUNI_03878 [Bacteroides uniformis ATCC 8492]|uniref:Uncharacterized protein n=1 Tax=Bacteroides uniformis (strain ATCC 8492 / DSM 6597 / CCUG 4942 / CIP 103695 / JCM 5828 / KCTC 5204 / NCTC 13054 / VPI 0061) TaxID=411479 RepID=A0ABC9N6D6_BACUC|nr:hypothetical protein BACUNI_03878 [Bacteroides uniformis ATCC 8492]
MRYVLLLFYTPYLVFLFFSFCFSSFGLFFVALLSD